jgi:hypothetical protein
MLTDNRTHPSASQIHASRVLLHLKLAAALGQCGDTGLAGPTRAADVATGSYPGKRKVMECDAW